MDFAVYVLGASVFCFFLAILAQGFKEPKTRMHALASNSELPEIAERHYNRVRNFQRFCMWAGVVLIVAAAATFIIPRWDNLQRNLNKGKQTSSLIQPSTGQHVLASCYN
ncbi:MAG: hypothetical protein ACOYUK_02950 [Patescibacteria group bacterium]